MYINTYIYVCIFIHIFTDDRYLEISLLSSKGPQVLIFFLSQSLSKPSGVTLQAWYLTTVMLCDGLSLQNTASGVASYFPISSSHHRN